MERGLLWLPLLAVFIGLAWAGWDEYQKVQAYQAWSVDFERSKYDIRAALGQAGTLLTWGRPTRQGPINTTSLCLTEVAAIDLEVEGVRVPLGQDLPRRGVIVLVLTTGQGSRSVIPFTDADLARRWQKVLQQLLETLKSAQP
jgi:hypothetical protein